LDATDCHVLPGVVDAHTHIALDTGIYRTTDDGYRQRAPLPVAA
jgi:dihydroorotase-like cyclic amidohydrolase